MALGLVTVDARQSVRVECVRQLHHMTNFKMFDIPALHHPTCEVKEEDQMHMGEFIRKFKYGTYNGFVKGWYGETEENPISEQCMGDWMHEDMKNVWPVFKKLFRGHWYQIGHMEAKNAADSILNMIYKNVEECGWVQVRDDMMEWCMNNKEQCLFGFMDAPERLANGEHTMELAAKTFDLFELIMADDTCMSDAEQVHSAARLAEDIGGILRDVQGFEEHLDLEKAHQSVSVFHFIHVMARALFHDLNMAVMELVRSIPTPHFWPFEHSHGNRHHYGQHGHHCHHCNHHRKQQETNPFAWLKCPFTGRPIIPENPFEGMFQVPQWGQMFEQPKPAPQPFLLFGKPN